MSEHPRIWLSPVCADPDDRLDTGEYRLCEGEIIEGDGGGRLWSEIDVWGRCQACGAQSVGYQLVPPPPQTEGG